jgi:hypothetical protein
MFAAALKCAFFPRVVAMMKALWSCALALAWTLGGCSALPFGYTKIGDIVAAPAKFEGQEVKVKGTVIGALQLPILDVKSYTLRDDSGEIAVLTHENVPQKDTQVALTGIVRSVAIVGGQSLGLRVEETRRY